MIVLGINDTHDASACLVKDGKLISSFPKQAVKNIFKYTGYKSKDVDIVAVGTNSLNGALL